MLDTGLDVSRKVVHKAAEFVGNRSADAVLLKTLATRNKSNDDNIENRDPVEEIIIKPEKTDEILNKLREVL